MAREDAGVGECERPCVEIRHLRELMCAELKARDMAQQKYESVLAVKMDHLNDIRPQLAAQKGDFISRREYEGKHDIISFRLDSFVSAKYISQQVFDERLKEVMKEIATLNRFMWLAVGVIAALEFILKFITK